LVVGSGAGFDVFGLQVLDVGFARQGSPQTPDGASAPERSSMPGDPDLQRFAGSIAPLRKAGQSSSVPQD